MAPSKPRRSVVDNGRFDIELRTLSYAMINSFVTQYATISAALEMRPAKLLVYLVVVASTVQKAMRATEQTEAFRAGVKMQNAQFGYISRRAIAAATGLPNENVRRIVNELIGDGLLAVGSSGGVRNTGGNLQNPRIIEALHTLYAEHLRTYQVFLDAGVVEIQ